MIEQEKIEPWVAVYRERYHGTLVETIGIDTVKNRVIFRRLDGYKPECVCPRRDWKKKYERVS